MPSAFSSQFRRAGAPSLVRQFGEDGIYYQGGLSPGRPVKVIVERTEEEVQGVIAQRVNCKVVDSCSTGIASTEIDDGRDEFAVALFEGGPLERRKITLMDDNSNGFVRFRVR